MTNITDSSYSNDHLLRLLQETASGDRDAFRLLYDSSSAKLFGVLLRILKRQDLAEDVLQEVYLVIWKKAKTYDPAQGRPLSWMVTIARNRAIDILRKTDERVIKHSLSEHDEDHFNSALSSISASEMDPGERIALQTCLDETEEQARQCVLLAYLYGYSREELAIRYSVPANTIKTWLRRALIDLKECLER